MSSWLFGKPLRTRKLVWPSKEADPELFAHRGTIHRRGGTSIIDGQIAYWYSLTEKVKSKTVVYLADIRQGGESETIAFERVAQLDYTANIFKLVPQVGFATAEWLKEESSVKFRSHSFSGQLLQEVTFPCKAAYGSFVLFGTTVSLCVTAGHPVPDFLQGRGFYVTPLRLDYQAGYSNHLPIDLIPDEILQWNATTGELKRIKIPQNEGAPVVHSADFEYLDANRIALAGQASDDGTPAGVLKVFMIANEKSEEILFSAVGHTSPECIQNEVGHPGSTTTSEIFVHSHDSGRRMTVFKRDLLTEEIHSSPHTDEGLRSTFQLPNDTRTIEYTIPYGGPVVSGNRILACRDENLYILDFDQTRLTSLVGKTAEERDELRAELEEADARVKVVTRRFYIGVEEDEDLEYPYPAVDPPEWAEHLLVILNRTEDEEGPLEYDEPPEEHRNPTPFGFVQTVLRTDKDIDPERTAFTLNSVIEVPEPGKDGYIFDFDV